MNDDTPIAKERFRALLGGDEQVEVGGLEGRGGDVAVFAGQVAHLACLRLGRVAGGDLAAEEGVEVGEGAGAGAVGGDGLVVDVVDWVGGGLVAGLGVSSKILRGEEKGGRGGWALTEGPEGRGWEAREVDVEDHACSVRG